MLTILYLLVYKKQAAMILLAQTRHSLCCLFNLSLETTILYSRSNFKQSMARFPEELRTWELQTFCELKLQRWTDINLNLSTIASQFMNLERGLNHKPQRSYPQTERLNSATSLEGFRTSMSPGMPGRRSWDQQPGQSVILDPSRQPQHQPCGSPSRLLNLWGAGVLTL